MPPRTSSLRVALIGDFNPGVIAHQAVPRALARAGVDLGTTVDAVWRHTATLGGHPAESLAGFDGVWFVPATPYANVEGVLEAIRHARETRRPLLGTCGGFQHVMLEYARNVLGIAHAAHAELDPGAADPVIAALQCSLVERAGTVRLLPDTRIARAYGTERIEEEYHCSYGLAPRLVRLLLHGPLHMTAWDPAGDVRAVELDDHPFFVATLFQSERRALRGETPPVVRAFVAAMMG
jgi:CTP synthase (UTP-ammonia lyase)